MSDGKKATRALRRAARKQRRADRRSARQERRAARREDLPSIVAVLVRAAETLFSGFKDGEFKLGWVLDQVFEWIDLPDSIGGEETEQHLEGMIGTIVDELFN